MHPTESHTRLELIDLSRQHEITFREPVDFVGPDCHVRLTPAKADIRMVALFFSQPTNSIDELKAFAKVLEPVSLLQMMFVNDLPSFQLA